MNHKPKRAPMILWVWSLIRSSPSANVPRPTSKARLTKAGSSFDRAKTIGQRFVDDDGNATYLGTYTAFSGDDLREELLRTTDFKTIDLTALGGSAARAKGMALFPRKIAGRYAMLGRQDHENIWLLTSNDLYRWDGGAKLLKPRWPKVFATLSPGQCPALRDRIRQARRNVRRLRSNLLHPLTDGLLRQRDLAPRALLS